MFDTNVLISALLLPESIPRHALNRVLSEGKVLLSSATLAELDEVLGRKRFRRYIDEAGVRSFLSGLARQTEWIDVDRRIAACRDPKDDKFLELAASGRATHIISGDADLLALHPFEGIAILAPRSFLEL